MPPHPLPIPYTGRLLVVLTRAAVDAIVLWRGQPGATDIPDLRDLADRLSFPSIRTALDAFGSPPSARAAAGLSLSQLFEIDEVAADGPYPIPHSAAAYWIVDPGGAEPRTTQLMAALRNARDAVAAVYREQAVGHPPGAAPLPVAEPFLDAQDHLERPPAGINARWVWEQLNLHGEGIDFIDIEVGWNLAHEDLVGRAPGRLTPAAWNDPAWEDHGTAVLALVGGDVNGLGVAGIAFGVNSMRVVSHWDGNANTSIGAAIATATSALSYGDVLLIEAQTEGNWPVELLNGDFELNMMRAAADKGIIVVESAGNGGRKMDGWVTSWTGPYDSRAIMVGASVGDPPEPGLGTVAHAPLPTSNVSARIDCFAPGVRLVTAAGDRSLVSAGPNDSYTKTFGETSGASAVIAGAALLAQHLHVSACGSRLGSDAMRLLLSNQLYGIRQGDPAPGNIGTMPDLRLIAKSMNDVYVRDYVGDTGAEPSTGPLSVSPDVIVVSAQPGNPQSAFGEGSGQEDSATLGHSVTGGADHYIYVRARNLGTCPANGVRATVYWSEVATLVTPAHWHLIGQSLPFPVAANDWLTVSPAIHWPAAQIPAPGHYCFVAELDTAGDPAPPQPGPLDWNGFLDYIRRYNNVTWRNLNVVSAAEFTPEEGLWFRIRGAPDQARLFEIELTQRVELPRPLGLDIPLGLLASLDQPVVVGRIDRGGEPRVVVELSRTRTTRWSVRLRRDAEHRCRLFLLPARGGRQVRIGPIFGSIVVRQLSEGEEVGRVTWLVREPGRNTP